MTLESRHELWTDMNNLRLALAVMYAGLGDASLPSGSCSAAESNPAGLSTGQGV
jgi:hypothetical protein